ncbi:MAG: DNA replication/repair protein RecF [candidate division KSB1 bacterium]|nr:DNA replication/repair protein RecF [candidate division KSB1 bacterium]MDZ7340954.1 DNA replication/repair protein RecF [candidate division KSB1 bacterium]
MKLASLELTDFRNYKDAQIACGPGINFVIGRNAQGKTNLLEAIYLLCFSKSFRTRYDKEAIAFQQPFFLIKGNFQSEHGNVHRLVLRCDHQSGKEILIDRKRIQKTSELLGKFPIVVSSPDEYAVTIGPPPERRKLVDILLSQLHQNYFSNLQEYHRILQQRNAILSNWKSSGAITTAVLDPWNQRLLDTGTQIMSYRFEFSKAFSIIINQIYSEFIRSEETVSFRYRANIEFDHIEDLKDRFEIKIGQLQKAEIRAGVTLAGPHRDDFIFEVNGKELKKYGSRGQHKTVLIALAMAEAKMLQEQLSEQPIILIDDLFSELDSDRAQQILDHLTKVGQVFVTATNMPKIVASTQNRYFMVENGKIELIDENALTAH